jgi:RNA polymerase sigma-70 factor (ECF subfamily)
VCHSRNSCAPFAEIAATLGRSEEAVKQLASRARAHIRRPRERAAATDARRILDRFAAAIAGGDLAQLTLLLTEDVVFLSDSGGKVPAAMVPVTGPDRVGRLLLGLARKTPAALRVRPARINGSAGFVFLEAGRVIGTLAIEIAGGRIAALYVTRNPDKLRAVAARGFEPARF